MNPNTTPIDALTTPEAIVALGAIDVEPVKLTQLAARHAVDVAAYRGTFAIVYVARKRSEATIASQARANLLASGGKATDKAVEEQVDSHPEVQKLRQQEAALEAGVETLKSREEMLKLLMK